MISAHSLGSRLAAADVDPLTSQNKIVTAPLGLQWAAAAGSFQSGEQLFGDIALEQVASFTGRMERFQPFPGRAMAGESSSQRVATVHAEPGSCGFWAWQFVQFIGLFRIYCIRIIEFSITNL
jgi:hypothetical protein